MSTPALCGAQSGLVCACHGAVANTDNGWLRRSICARRSRLEPPSTRQAELQMSSKTVFRCLGVPTGARSSEIVQVSERRGRGTELWAMQTHRVETRHASHAMAVLPGRSWSAPRCKNNCVSSSRSKPEKLLVHSFHWRGAKRAPACSKVASAWHCT